MTYKELSQNIGKTASLTVALSDSERLVLPVTIIDARQVWGRTDYQIDFNGQKAWSSDYHVKLSKDNSLVLNGSMVQS